MHSPLINSLFSSQSEKIWQDIGVDLSTYTADFSLATSEPNAEQQKEPFSLTTSAWKPITFGKYVCTRLAMAALYPAQSNLASITNKNYSLTQLDRIRVSSLQGLVSQGYLVRRVILEKGSLKCDGLIVTTDSALNSRKWILQMTGCSSPIESSIADIAKIYLHPDKHSLLMINGPSVGRSKGQATFQSLAEAQELGIRYLEEKIQATHIALVGHSFGGAILGQSLMQHVFQSHIRYVVVRQMSFCCVTQIAKSLTPIPFCDVLLNKLELEIDGTKVSKVLEDKGIQEIIIQATHRAGTPERKEDFTTDQVIPGEVCLGAALIRQQAWSHKTFIGLGPVGHADMILWQRTVQLIENHWNKIKGANV